MIKEEKIKEAWGEYWDSVSRHHQYEGWINRWAWDFRNDLEMEEVSGKNSPSLVRPKSLQRIGNNNGWVKIESEADLPKKNIECFFMFKGDLLLGSFFIDDKCFYWNDSRDFENKEVTHYQPIEKPKPPIY